MGEFTDDSTIGDDQIIWRRVSDAQTVWDNNLKRKRPSSAAFNQNGRANPVSVYIASEAQCGRAVIEEGTEPFLAALTVGFIRQVHLGIIRDSSSGSPGHALLLGRKTKSTLHKMARAAKWVEPYAP